AERLSTLQNIERQTLEEERKIARISQVISQYEQLKRALR
ncbi:conjugal transfer protein TraI, partial [Salmonella enterica subsp. enterica]|nr:conjugal transfer protein TraI [Salmonella enterica subsp. enterica]